MCKNNASVNEMDNAEVYLLRNGYENTACLDDAGNSMKISDVMQSVTAGMCVIIQIDFERKNEQ